MDRVGRLRQSYRLLGVDANASAADLRAAYLSLLKRYHPDCTPPGADRRLASDYTAALNVAYAALLEHRARSAPITHSAAGVGSQRSNAIVACRTETRADSPVRNEAGLPDRRTNRVLAWAAAIALAIFLLAQIRVVSTTAPGGGRGALARSDPVQRLPVLPYRRAAAAVVDRAVATPADKAAIESQACFGQLADGGPESAAVSCIVFDDAILLSQGEKQQSEYFQANWVRTRHLGALSLWNADNLSNLEELNNLTAALLLERLEARRAAQSADDQGPDHMAAALNATRPMSRNGINVP